ncbi:hypothetical protein PHMEG_0001729 [Phytophthora megakarya]|uniref:L-amino acid ligase C-terminal domain-containing protein n=1 Tax=Phytophthora megakarya TaxID=4795 RepID=A0A225X2C4_9STRA|nr:hypothetical protein PHMEG_0001729 [Phytophthora megakarya]
MGNAAAKEAVEPPKPPSFRVLSADQRAVTFDERVHLRTGAEARADRVTLGLGAMSDFRPLQRAATYDPRLRSQKQLLTASDVMHRRFFNARERRVSATADRNLFRIAESDRERQEAVVVVDPYSTGMTMAQKVLERGYLCVCVYSDTLEVTQERIAHVPKDLASKFLAVIYHDGEVERRDEAQALKDTAAALRRVKSVDIVGIFAGAETGVLLADKLSEHFKLTTNGTSGSAARRNKYLMGEKVRASGLRAVAQVQATKWSQVEAFVKKELVPMLKGGAFKVIVKPVESAGSDDVMLCHSMEEVVAVWEYDKRAVNDAPFVYYGVLLRAAPDGSVLAKVADYVLKVVKALEIVHGPGHAEVKVVRGEPCLVEIGSRCHGGSGSYLPIVNPCLGYNHVDAALDSYLDAEAFERLPERPKELKSHGCEAMLVSYGTGKLAGYPGQEELENLPSTVSTMWFTHIGEELKTTVDMFTTPGSVIMVHKDEKQLNHDYARIRELEHKGLYELEPEDDVEAKSEGPRGTVVVVDPFSTGAVLAHELMTRGYECICVYSDRLENIESVASLVPEGLTLEFAATVAFEGNLNQTVSAIRKAAKQVADKQSKKKHGGKPSAAVCAVFAGAELGVKLSDALTDALGLEGNVMEHSNARRDKYLMGETLRSAGRRVNDAAFVYFGLSLVPAEGIVNEMIDYQFQVLDALGIRNGPAHGEVKFCRGSPVLIEVGSRCHGGEGAWVPIANICVGYNQVTASVDSVLDAEVFAELPDRPCELLAYGCEAMLVSYKNGVLKSTPGIAEIEKMPAFLKKEIFVAPGDNVRQTVDMFTTPGSIMLTHEDRDVLESSLARIRELEVEGLFVLE